MALNVFNQTEENLKELEDILNEVFSKIKNLENFSVIFITNNDIQSLNKKYRNVDAVTDVLSFVSDEEDYIGDIFIAVERAKEQALDYNNTLKREISFLAVHGYLHLKGYDHQTKEAEKQMNELTEEILSRSNVKRGIE